MFRATFLDHSGFLVELSSVTLLFDWWKGELPPLRSKPLLVFASHAHSDHFRPKIFSLPAHFVLGSDISADDIPDGASCTRMAGGETQEILPGVTVETLPSTDEGVAFLVTAEGRTIFHAGDLNWWHWEGEPDPWNPDMARNFQAFCEPLRGRSIDLAMLPLDPRLEAAGFWGPRYFLELARIRRFLPMHQWKNFEFTAQFLAAHPQFAPQTMPVTAPGQSFALE